MCQQGGVAGAKFSTDVTFSVVLFFNECLFIVVVFIRKKYSLAKANYRGIWAIWIFPSESCKSVSKGTFREFRPFSVIAEIFSPRTP